MKLDEYIKKSAAVVSSLNLIQHEIDKAAKICIDAVLKNKTVFFCGNGGSAAEAQHFSAEFLGRFLSERNPLPSISLSVDTSAITAIGNDYGFDQIFSRQLAGLAKPDDVLVGISTSGNSENVVKAFEMAKKGGVKTISLTSERSCKLDDISDVSIKPLSSETNFIQEAHLVIGHYLCMQVEKQL